MAAGVYKMIIEQGANLRYVFNYTDSAGTAINLTGYTVRMQVRATKAQTTTLLDIANGAGISITDAAAGQITLDVPAATTAALPGDTLGVYDIELVNGSTVTRFLEGVAVISGEVTR